MPSTGPFAAFDYPSGKLEHVPVTPASVNQTTGAITAPALGAVVAISGNLMLGPQNLDDRQAGGVIDEGEAILFTDTIIAKGDRVRVKPPGATTFDEYEVMGTREYHGVLGAKVGSANRREYLLKLRVG